MKLNESLVSFQIIYYLYSILFMFFTNIYFIIPVIIIILLAFKYIIHQYNLYIINQENRFILDPEELEVSNYITYNENVVYVLWNGEKRSTTYIFNLLLRENRIVQPIYIMNNELEVKNMKRSRHAFNKKFPSLRIRLLPTMYFTSIDKNNQIKSQYKKKKKRIMENIWNEKDDLWIKIFQCVHGFRKKTFVIQWPFNKELLVYPIILELINDGKYTNLDIV